MPDDLFLLTVELPSDWGGLHLARWSRKRQLVADLRERLPESAHVSHESSQIFVRTDSESAGREAELLARALLAEHGQSARLSLLRWHPDAGRWGDTSIPPPAADAERGPGSGQRQERDDTPVARVEDALTPEAKWQVRLKLPSRRQAVEVATRLERSGIRFVRRWRTILVGARTRERADRLYERLLAEVPETRQIEVEPAIVAIPGGAADPYPYA